MERFDLSPAMSLVLPGCFPTAFASEVRSLVGGDHCQNFGMGIPINRSTPTAEEGSKAWQFKKGERTDLGVQLSNDNEDEEGVGSSIVKDVDEGVQGKLCARGHWRPAEDAKLRELVAHYGPQNWNLIAEKLQGRSGNILRLQKNHLKKDKNFFFPFTLWAGSIYNII